MEFEKLNNIISEIKNTDFFVSDNIKKINNKFNEFTSIIDARSLAFFSIGVNNINCNNKNICIIISSNELSSILTAVTEAKYQQQKMIIISLGNKIQKESFIDVTDGIVISNDEKEIKSEIEKYINEKYFKPLLINMEINTEKHKNNYEIIQTLLNKIEENEIILTNLKNEINNNKLVSWDNDYGVISRYLGNLLANNKNKLYLLTDYDSLFKDINAFYTRYINKSVVIFCIKDENTIIRNNFKKWTKENNIDFIEAKKDLENINLKNIKKQTIIEISI